MEKPQVTRPLLFTPMSLRSVALKNRIVVAPMHQYAAVKGFANDWHLMNIGRYAAGGAGLCFMESTKVERRGCGTVGDLGLWDDAFVPGLARCVDFIHAQGAAAGIQLGHSGGKSRRGRPWEGGRPLEPTPEIAAQVDDWDAWEPVGPSADEAGLVRPLSADELPGVVESFAAAARRADAAGFDTVEVHGAHGFLLHQFLSPEANRRNDGYGGTETNRMRLVVEVCEAVRAAWPADKPLFLRLSVEDNAGWGPAESSRLAAAVKALGVDVIDCSGGGMRPNPPAPLAYGYQVPFAEQVRRDGGIMTMAVGLIVHADQAEAILQEGRADLVALARELIYNPNWPLDAARKLGVEDAFALTPPAMGWWLERREVGGADIRESTYAKGIEG